MIPFRPIVRRTSDRDVPRELAQSIVRAGLGPDFHYAGNASLASAPLRIAMIGSREPSGQGATCMEALASSLSGQGAIIVSGAAHGTDMAAHRGALAVGGGTIAILPMGIPVGGLDRLSPLLDTLTDPALLLMVAPFALSQIISRTTPVIRNRLIATLAHAVVVGEAGPQSGTLHCVRFARELGIPIFLLRDPHIPRDPDLNAIHEGLIRQGASPFSVDDCWGTELAARIVRVARLDQDQRRAAERAQLSLFGELGE